MFIMPLRRISNASSARTMPSTELRGFVTARDELEPRDVEPCHGGWGAVRLPDPDSERCAVLASRLLRGVKLRTGLKSALRRLLRPASPSRGEGLGDAPPLDGMGLVLREEIGPCLPIFSAVRAVTGSKSSKKTAGLSVPTRNCAPGCSSNTTDDPVSIES
jgi:hypothetical protein